MCGNIASVLLWLLATDFRTFLASRIVGGLSEGNVQIATAIATDISDEKQRGATMALVGACFCVSLVYVSIKFSFSLGEGRGARKETARE
jgi:predicted MFS family arabinose efflux permease